MSDTPMPPVRPMPLTMGGWPALEDIVGRDETVDILWQSVERSSLLINEIRRFGKSNILRLMEQRVPEGWICVRYSVQDAGSTKRLVEVTLEELNNHTGITDSISSRLREAIRNIKGIKIAGAEITLDRDERDSWRALRSVLDSIDGYLDAEDKRLLIIWDEFPDAIRSVVKSEGPQAAEDILLLFRSLRENARGQRIRWILTGSVGFHHILRSIKRHSVEVNDMASVQLEPLSPEWSRWMMECLLLGSGVAATSEATTALAKVSGGIPFIMMMLVKTLSNQPELLPADLVGAEEVLVEAANDPSLRYQVAPLVTRIEDYYEGEERVVAYAALDAISNTPLSFDEVLATVSLPDGVAIGREQLKDVLDLLCDDHYLTYTPGARLYSWRHAPLRVIWRARREPLL